MDIEPRAGNLKHMGTRSWPAAHFVFSWPVCDQSGHVCALLVSECRGSLCFATVLCVCVLFGLWPSLARAVH